MRTISAEHLKMHDDSNLIQAVTASKIRLPRLWANRKEMKPTKNSNAGVHADNTGHS